MAELESVTGINRATLTRALKGMTTVKTIGKGGRETRSGITDLRLIVFKHQSHRVRVNTNTKWRSGRVVMATSSETVLLKGRLTVSVHALRLLLAFEDRGCTGP